MTGKARIRGILAPVLTPFTTDLEPDAPRLLEHCRWLLSRGAGLAVFGTNSEANSLSVREKLDLLEFLVSSGIDPARMMPGTGCCAFPDTVALTRAAVAAGCVGVLMLPPFYYKDVSDEGLFRAYSEVIQRVGDASLRIYLYHIPPVSHVPLSLPLIAKLLTHYPGVIAGIKDSSGDWNHTATLLREFQSDSFDVFCGSEDFLRDTLALGGAGSISATANVNPAAIVDLYTTWQEDGAAGKQKALSVARKAFAAVHMVSSMKAAIARARKHPAWAVPRPPLVPAPEDVMIKVFARLDEIGFAGLAGLDGK